MTSARYKRTGKPVFCSDQCREFWFPKHDRRQYLATYDPERERAKYLRQKAELGGRTPRYNYVHEYPDFQPALGQCLTCQRMFPLGEKRRRLDCHFCSPACNMWMRSRQALKYSWHSSGKTYHSDDCATCGTPIKRYNSRQRYCSQKCKRAKSKRCGQLSPKVYAQVVARDGWWCHLCGDLIDPNLSRFDRMAMTMDHLIPVSLGGSDDPGNLRPAHRSCNSKRSNKPLSRAVW
jgi:5-methylcytosine-specific restriction endonuclease McrA